MKNCSDGSCGGPSRCFGCLEAEYKTVVGGREFLRQCLAELEHRCGEWSEKWEEAGYEIIELKAKLAAAEKERDELASAQIAYNDRAKDDRKMIATRDLKIIDLEAKLSLYESAPSEPEVNEALEYVENPKSHFMKPYVWAAGVLANAYRSCQAKLAEAVEDAANFEMDSMKWKDREAGMAKNHLDEMEKVAELEARLEEAVQALEKMQEFHDCMEAQRKDEPLPEDHDYPDEACGDGSCYVVGKIIERGIAVARHLRSGRPSPLAALKERVIEAARPIPMFEGSATEHGRLLMKLRHAIAALDSAQRKEKIE